MLAARSAPLVWDSSRCFWKPSWATAETSPCSTHYVIGKASLLRGSRDNAVLLLPALGLCWGLGGLSLSCTHSSGCSLWAPSSAVPAFLSPQHQLLAALALCHAQTHSWGCKNTDFTLQGSSACSGIWLWEGESQFGAQQSCWQDSCAQGCREAQQELAVSHQGHPTALQHQPGPCAQLQTAANSCWKHQSIHGLAASFAPPNRQGCSRIHCCNQRWELPTVLSHLPPPLPHGRVSLGQSGTPKIQHFEGTVGLGLALSPHPQARLKPAQTKCAHN